MQVMARWMARVPQWIWAFLGTLAYIAVAIPVYSHFESALKISCYSNSYPSNSSSPFRFELADISWGTGILAGYLRRYSHNRSHPLQERDERVRPIDLCVPAAPASTFC